MSTKSALICNVEIKFVKAKSGGLSSAFHVPLFNPSRPANYESTGLNSPFDTLNIGLYNVFFGRH